MVGWLVGWLISWMGGGILKFPHVSVMVDTTAPRRGFYVLGGWLCHAGRVGCGSRGLGRWQGCVCGERVKKRERVCVYVALQCEWLRGALSGLAFAVGPVRCGLTPRGGWDCGWREREMQEVQAREQWACATGIRGFDYRRLDGLGGCGLWGMGKRAEEREREKGEGRRLECISIAQLLDVRIWRRQGIYSTRSHNLAVLVCCWRRDVHREREREVISSAVLAS